VLHTITVIDHERRERHGKGACRLNSRRNGFFFSRWSSKIVVNPGF
jgi:hypothetical protein